MNDGHNGQQQLQAIQEQLEQLTLDQKRELLQSLVQSKQPVTLVLGNNAAHSVVFQFGGSDNITEILSLLLDKFGPDIQKLLQR